MIEERERQIESLSSRATNTMSARHASTILEHRASVHGYLGVAAQLSRPVPGTAAGES